MTATRSNTIGTPGCNKIMFREPESVQRTRRIMDTLLSTWRLNYLLGGGALIISEPVGNAIQKTTSRSLRTTEGVDAASGRGLLLVHELVDRGESYA